MGRISDQNTLLKEQDKTPVNFNARAKLHARFSTNRQNWHDWVFSHFQFPEGVSVLEIGCGLGRLWLENCRRVKRSWNITLADFSSGMLEQARADLSESVSGFNFQLADIQDLPFRDGSFDGVIANHMLYHVPDLEKGLSEVRRVLKSSGIFYAATNGINHMVKLWHLMSEFLGVPVPVDNGDYEFRIDNGKAILSRYFGKVEFVAYDDELRITEVEPLVEYFYSSKRISDPITNRRPEFQEFLEKKMGEAGVIRIRKEVGLFVAE